MLKRTKFTSLLLVIVLVLSIVGGTSALAEGPPSPVESEPASEVVTNAEEGPYEGTIPEEGLNSSLGQVTLTVGGVETQIVPGTEYTAADDAYISITTAAGDYASEKNIGVADYRTALFVGENGIDEAKSVLGAIAGGNYDDAIASDLAVDSNSDNFNGVILVNAGEYKIANSVFNYLSNADGSNSNDFVGHGSVLSAFGDNKLIVDSVTINTEGVARPAIIADDGADVLVQNSTFNVAGGTLYEGYVNNANQATMVAPPWVLGISGNARAVNLLGDYSTATFVNSTITADEWGSLSTDGCSDVVLTTIDSTVEVSGDSGYGTYAIGDAEENFYGTTFDVATFANIVTGGFVTYASSNGSFTVEKNDDAKTPVFENIEGAGNVSTVNSDAFGIMWHGNGGANIIEDSVFNTQNAIFLVKNGTVAIDVDDAELNSADGVILQMMDNDDSVVGIGDFATFAFATEYSEEVGYPGIDNNVAFDPEAAGGMSGPPPGDEAAPEGEGAQEAEQLPGEVPEGGFPEPKVPENAATKANGEFYSCTANFKNVTLDGDMYNGTGYLGAPKSLIVTLGSGAELTGAISATSAIHSTDGGETQNSHFTIDEYYMLNHVANKAYYNGNNDVDVVVADGGVWNVEGDCYLTSLTVEQGGTLNGTVHVDGAVVKVEAGTTYTGSIFVAAGSQSNVLLIVLIAAAVLIVAALITLIARKKATKKA